MRLKLSELANNHFNSHSSMANLILNQIESGFYKDFEVLFKDGIVLDCGANIGLYSIYASQIANKVISVEPTKSHLGVFKSLIEANKISNITIDEVALAPTDGNLTFYESASNSTTNSIIPYGPGARPSYEVQSYSLPTILSRNLKDGERVSFAKIDIEGSESLLFNSESFIKGLEKVDNLFIELHVLNWLAGGGEKEFNRLYYDWTAFVSSRKLVKSYRRIGIDGILFNF
jgi:FkbM family methyltransferase